MVGVFCLPQISQIAQIAQEEGEGSAAVSVKEDDSSLLRFFASSSLRSSSTNAPPRKKVQDGLLDGPDDEKIEIAVTLVAGAQQTQYVTLVQAIVKSGGVILRGDGLTRRVAARVTRAVLRALLARADVKWIERKPNLKLLNDVVVNEELANIRAVWENHGLTGAGQNIITSDSGIDTGDLDTLMDDLKDRVVCVRSVDGGETADTNGHGTHTAGTLVGTGVKSDGQIRGMAYDAKLWAWNLTVADGLVFPGTCQRLFQPDLANFPAYLHSASWGDDANPSSYTELCQLVDAWLWEHPETLAVFAAGNDGRKGQMKINAPGGAKNVLCVGATESVRAAGGTDADNPAHIAGFSSRGPMVDGRIKPDICAPGSYVRSTRTQVGNTAAESFSKYYKYLSGTSMATPVVAGAAVLARQWLMERRGYTNELPTGALLKAILMGGAHDLATDEGTNCGGAAPNSAQGWGRLDLGETLYPSNRTVLLRDRIPFSRGSDWTVTLNVTNAAPLDVQLVWFDYPAEPSADRALVNDLDLFVVCEETGERWLGNDVSGTGEYDDVNTAESVRLPTAAPGTYVVHVRGAVVAYTSSQGGAAAVYARGAFTENEETVETVTLTVQVADEAGAGRVQPPVGTWRVAKNKPITLSALPITRESVCGTEMWRRGVTGWTGTGNLRTLWQQSGDRIIKTFTQNSTIKWNWSSTAECLVQYYCLTPSLGADTYFGSWYQWVASGSRDHLEIPDDIPTGSEICDIRDMESRAVYYTDEDGTRKQMCVQRLGRIEVAETDADTGTAQTDAAGRMATAFDVTITNGTDILFYYWDTASVNAATGLPNWWFQRYLREADVEAGRLAADADADGDGMSNLAEFRADTDPLDADSDFRILSFTATNIVWRGGRERTQVVERTDRLGPNAVWTGVFTNAPPTAREGCFAWPRETFSNSFYRVRAF